MTFVLIRGLNRLSCFAAVSDLSFSLTGVPERLSASTHAQCAVSRPLYFARLQKGTGHRAAPLRMHERDVITAAMEAVLNVHLFLLSVGVWFCPRIEGNMGIPEHMLRDQNRM